MDNRPNTAEQEDFTVAQHNAALAAAKKKAVKAPDKKPVNKAAKPSTKKAPASKAKAPAKKADAKPKTPAARKSRVESDSENVKAIVKLASRPQGATRKELEEATGWKNAGWPWLFFNKNTGKGIAPRHDMDFSVIERPAKEGERAYKAYKLTPKKAA